MLQPEYKRDMYKSYLVLKEEKENPDYSMKMLAKNKIAGFLDLEICAVDNRREYYYEITQKQTMNLVFQKTSLTEVQIKNILSEIIRTIKQSREYLLSEDSFVLEPEYIYMSLDGTDIKLMYFAGYEERVGEQLLHLIEYMMDKVDYKDKTAVCLIYGIYKICRAESCTFERILEYLDSSEIFEKDLTVCEAKEQERMQQKEIFSEVEEEVESEVEKKRYPLWVWLGCGFSVLVSMGLIGLAANTGMITDVVTGKIMLGKMAAVLGVTGALEAYCLMRFLDEKNKIAYIAKKIEYRKPNEEVTHIQREKAEYREKNPKKEDLNRSPVKVCLEKKERIESEGNSDIYTYECADAKEEQAEQATVILAERGSQYVLLPERKDMYVPIYMQEFPFFIGTLKTKVDYAINSHSVSRFHAKIERVEEEFYIADLNSTNGTFVNGIRLSPNGREKIKEGDWISFADVAYQFSKK